MKLNEVVKDVLTPMYKILGSKYESKLATLMLLSIGLQESKFQSRQQIISKNGKLVPEGPAVSFWQFEKGGGVKGVMTHIVSQGACRALCKARGVAFDAGAIWEAMKSDDILGAGMARLLLYTDPFALPKVDDDASAWELYVRVWRPGKPHPETWPANHVAAKKAL